MTRIGRPRRCLAGATAAAVVVAQFALPPCAAASPLGSTTASAGSAPPPAATLIESFQPDLFTGRATAAIPIVVPPGRKGLQPNLALSYSSSGRNGWVGGGWSLELGGIERSTKQGVPAYGSSDTFTLQFQGVTMELVRIPDGTYRAKDEGLFLRVADLGVNGWEVRDKAGTRYLFGGTPDSEQAGASGTFGWALRKVLDPDGNTLFITYANDQGQRYPLQIRYTGHEPSGLAPANTVDFLLESRQDIETSSRSGALVTTAKRLKAITVSASTQPVRTYRLAYTSSPRTGRSLLSSVTQVGADGISTLPATTFTYQSTAEPTYALVSNMGLRGSNLWNVRCARKDWGDINGAVLYPSQITSWSETSAPFTQASGSSPGIAWSTDGQGNLSVGGDRDMNVYLWTFVFTASAKTVSVNLSQSEDSQVRFFINGSTSEVPGWPTKSLPLNAGWNLIEITSYNQNAGFGWDAGGSLASQVTIMNPTQFLQPSLSGDFNGDGLTDLSFFDQPSGTWTVSLADPSPRFDPARPWVSGFGSTSTAPVLGDWDGDGRTDIATYAGGNWQFARSTGTSFQAGALPALSFGSGTPVMGDFNGDGMLDLGTYNAGSWSVALRSGSGFTAAGSFSLSFGSSSDEPLTGDFNGDGLTDLGIVNRSSGDVAVALSNGSRFMIQSGAWRTGFGAGWEHLVADFNGDGLSDVAFHDQAAGRVTYAASTGTSLTASKAVEAVFSMRNANHQVQVGDYNGDGLADPGVFDPVTGQGELALSSGTVVDLLSGMANGLGGTTMIGYVPSSRLDNTGGDGLPDLPFVVPVVDSLILSDGLGRSYTTRFSYTGGRYDAPSKEFRGFAKVTVADPELTASETFFLQAQETRGRVERTTVADKDGRRYSEQVNTWQCSEAYPGVSFCRLTRQVGTLFDGDATSRQTATSYDYDGYGNLIEAIEEGETGALGDERTTQIAYALNPAEWMVNRPAAITVFGPDGVTKLTEQRLFYDNHPSITDPPSTGRVTKVQEWLDVPASTYLSTTLTYDAYGNVTRVTAPLNHRINLSYDTATKTFPRVLTNAAGHLQRLEHDPRFGVVTGATDPNNVTTTAAYDAFGRPVALIGPNDSAGLPTVSVEYDLSTVPNKVTTRVREHSGATSVLTSYAFTDGLGHAVQTRSPAEDPARQVVSGAIELTSRGAIAKQWVPYLSAASSSYVPLSSEPGAATLPATTYRYDPIGRVTSIIEADSATTTVAYDDWAVTVTDANGHQTRRVHDAHGRPVAVEEFSGGQTYTTAYHYDPLDRLVRVVDAQGHETRLSYDSLSRRISAVDPDMGPWTYGYDAVDNLASQTDARGVTTRFTRDLIGRVTQTSYTIPPSSGIADPGAVAYTYDDPAVPFSKDQVTAVTDSTGSSSFAYDNLGRTIQEVKTVGGTAYTFQAGFDLLDRLTTLTSPDGEAVAYTYNPQGGIERVASAEAVYVQDIDYNALDQPTALVLGNGVATDYTYDPRTLRLSSLVTRHQSLGTRLQEFAYAYDPAGNLTRIDDLAAGTTQRFAYDDLDRLTNAAGPYGIQSFSYDPIGNLITKGGVTLTYGHADGSQPHAATAASDGWVFAYDPNGNMVSKTAETQTPAARALAAKQFRFDADNRLVQVDVPTTETIPVNLQPGWNFFALPVIPDDLSIAAVFPAFGADIDQISRYNPATDRFEHYLGDATFDDFTSVEYGRGYEVYCSNPNGIQLTFTGKSPSAVPSYAFTSGSQLIGSSALSPQTTGWLLNGLASGTDYDTIHRYDTTAQALAPATQAQPAEAYFLHALKTTSWTPPRPKDVSTRLTYDASGDRITQSGAAGTATYVSDSFEVEGGVTTKHVFAGGFQVASKTSGAQTRFYHPDHLGSTHIVTDTTGAVLQRLSYLPFGETFTQSGSVDVPQKFTGQRFDRDTNLYFYNARYYDPSIGRFLSADPIVQDPFDPQFLNRFAYVRNNPLKYTDPSGLFVEQAIDVGYALLGNGLEALSALTPLGALAVVAAIAAVVYFLVKLFHKPARPSLPPGPIQPTPLTPLTSQPGVGFSSSGQLAQILQGTQQMLGGFGDQALDAINALQEAITTVRVEEGSGKFTGALQLIEGTGWVALGTLISTIDGPFPIADAGGIAVASQGIPLIQAGGAVLTGIGATQLINAPSLSYMKPKAGSPGGRGAGKRFSEKTKDLAREEAGGECVFCDKQTTRKPGPRQSNVDHAHPRSRGGNNSPANAQNTCRSCNLDKKDLTTEEYLRVLGR